MCSLSWYCSVRHVLLEDTTVVKPIQELTQACTRPANPTSHCALSLRLQGSFMCHPRVSSSQQNYRLWTCVGWLGHALEQGWRGVGRAIIVLPQTRLIRRRKAWSQSAVEGSPKCALSYWSTQPLGGKGARLSTHPGWVRVSSMIQC